jgi:hypothetical protein
VQRRDHLKFIVLSPGLVIGISDGASSRASGVVHRAIEATEARQGVVDERVNIIGLRDVGTKTEGVRSQERLRAREPFIISSTDSDARSFTDELLRQSETETIASAGDENNTISEF